MGQYALLSQVYHHVLSEKSATVTVHSFQFCERALLRTNDNKKQIW